MTAPATPVTGTPRYLGLHLLQPLDLVDSPRPSCLAELDAHGVLTDVRLLTGDDAIAAAAGRCPGVLAVDAPLAVPNPTGRRDVEVVLSWLDVPAFPVSRRRMAQIAGGVRGERLGPRLAAPGRMVVEAIPDQVLRELMWEAAHPDGSLLDLAEYRQRWLGLRPPRYRPKGAGRAQPRGIAPALALLAGVVDLGGWRPPRGEGDWGPIADAAALDAIACAYAAWRLGSGQRPCLVVGTPERGIVCAPADVNMLRRAQVNLDRLRREGAIAI